MQAASGTSLEPGDSTDPTNPPAMPRARMWRVFALVALVMYAVDVSTKILALEKLEGRDDVPVIGDLLQLHLTSNAGAAFSTGTQFTVVLTCIAIAAVIVVL